MITGPTLTRDTILEHARSLPAAPQVMAGLSELLQDINTDLEQIADQVRVDPALTARVIRISNSPVFGGGARIGSVDEAVNRVGFGEVMRLVGVATVAGMVDRALSCYKIPAEKLRETLLLHALASEALASHTEIDPRTAYAGGLLRGIGMMIVDRMGRERLQLAEVFDPQQFGTYWEWENARFGLGSPEVATTVLDDWRFPAELISAVQEHLLVTEAGLQDPFACVLNLAGAVVAANGLALPGETACWALTPEKLQAAGIDADQFEMAADRALTQFEQQRTALY